MLSLASGSLAKALRTSQQPQANCQNINKRFLTNDAGSSGSSGRRSEGRSGGNRGTGAYTFQQAFDKTQGGGAKASGGQSGPRNGAKGSTLEENRKASEARFAGAKRTGGGSRAGKGQGKYASMEPRGAQEGDGAGKGGVKMPQDQARTPRSAEEVRASRERIEGQGRRFGERQAPKTEGMYRSSQRSVGASGTSKMMENDGDDRAVQGGEGREGGERGQGRRDEQGGQRGGQKRFGKLDFSKAPSAKLGAAHVVPAIGTFGLEAQAAQERRRRGRGDDEGEKLGGGVPDLFSDSDAMSSRRSGSARAREARLKELDRLADEADAAESKVTTKEGPKMIDQDLANLTEADEQGEERLISDEEEMEETEERDLEAIKQYAEAARRTHRESIAEKALVDALPTWNYADHEGASSVSQDPALQRIVKMAMPVAISEQELLDADDMEDVLGEDAFETALDLEAEQLIMESQFAFGERSGDVTLHSEKGLLYGVVDTFDRMMIDKKRKLIVRARQHRRFQIWRAESWPKREKKIKERNARKARLHKEAQATWAHNAADENMCYYPELHLWFSKDELKSEILRNAISGVLSNPSWNRARRREYLIGVQKDIAKMGQPLPPNKQLIADTVWNIPKKPASSDLRTIEHLHTLPITDWSLMIAQAERTMDPTDRVKRFDPSPWEKKNNAKL